MSELQQAARFLAAHVPAAASVLVAVSGGLDSMCLLHFVAAQGFHVTAAHFNHQLRGSCGDMDEAFVRDWCASRQIPFVCGSGDTRALAAQGMGLEEAARTLRYAWLETAAKAQHCAYILTAHHGDDNGETLLLNLLRGTGLKGLTGIPPLRGNILRPFLPIPKAALVGYAEHQQLAYREDETNALDDASRNLLRHKVLPVLKELNPRAVEHMAQTMALLAEDEAALTADAKRLMALAQPIPGGFRLARAELLSFFPALQKRAILGLAARLAGHSQNFSARHAAAVLRLADSGSEQTVVALPYGVTAQMRGNYLLLTRAAVSPEAVAIAVGETVSFGDWTVTLSAQGGTMALSAAALALPLRITHWRAEDRIPLPGARGSRSLKRLCADAGISPPRRELLPVLRMGDTPIALPHIGKNARFAPKAEETAVFVTFKIKQEESHHDE